MRSTVIGGLGAPGGVFISPDGQWVGFFDGNPILRKVAITGGPPVTITRVDGAGSRGATWGPDGTIIFATIATATGLQRVSAAGGDPAVLTKPDRARGEGDHFWPEFLPGGEAVLFTIQPNSGNNEDAQVAVLDLRTGMSKVLIRGGTRTLCRRVISCTASLGRCAPWPSTSDGWRWSGRLRQCSRGW